MRLKTSPVLPVVLMFFLGGCSLVGRAGSASPVPLLSPKSEEMNLIAPDTFKVLVETTNGDLVLEVYRDWAPLGADRFFNLVRNGYYNDTFFFRTIAGFVAQFGIHGQPEVSAAWKDARINDDSVRVSNERGTISFAMAGPNTRTVQLFINQEDNDRLDRLGFAPFGKVTGGMDTVDRLYSGYGEGAPQGRGPSQDRISLEGNAYLRANFPLMDAIKRAWILPDERPAAENSR
ncbi:MAG: peptidylprolyl isomerase [Gemmatimonadota bacterium]|jgi:peptidyl-prolyl cis-trans isomerase A (cyclophilin A)|nr:peptidylprolyl isomerase [Gemmatimonadota bacterium]